MKLSGKQKNHLRGLGHHLKPSIKVGKEGVSEKFLKNLEDCLVRHELLKIKILENVEDDKKALSLKIEKATKGNVVQIIGKMLLFYRSFKEESVIKLP